MKNKLSTFKQWRTLHEGFLGGVTNLGVSQANVIGGVVSNSNLSSLEESLDDLDLDSLTMLEEACKKAKAKKSKKKMFADLGEKKPEIDVEEKPEEDHDEPDGDEKDHDEPDGDEEGEEGESDDDGDEEVDVKEPGKDIKVLGKEKPEIMLAKKKAKKKMTKEDVQWWNSVSRSASLKNDDAGNWDGVSAEPQAGEPGFAPQGRLGWFN